jgi:hypothetical protein
MITLKMISQDDNAVRASRSFFSHCVRPGEYDLVMLSNSVQGKSYTLTLKFKPVYSYFSLMSQRHILFDAEDPPLLPLANKVAMVEMCVISARAEIAGLDLRRLDPFVQVQVAGMQADVRDHRTPRASNCHVGGGPATDPAVTDASTSCLWYYPLRFTISWSEFAFLRMCLRTFDHHQPADLTGKQQRSRRGSLAQTLTTTSGGAQLIARRTLWVEALKTGYHSVQLFNYSDRLVATLLCHFTVKNARENTFEASEREKFITSLMGVTEADVGDDDE